MVQKQPDLHDRVGMCSRTLVCGFAYAHAAWLVCCNRVICSRSRKPGVVKHPRDLRLDEKEPKKHQFLRAISGLPVNLFMPGEATHPLFPEFRLVWTEGKKTTGEPWKAASAPGPAVPPPTITPSVVAGRLTGRVFIYHGPFPTDSLNVADVHWPN